MAKPKPKDIKLPTPSAAQERLAPALRARLKEAMLEQQLAHQLVELLASKHGHAVIAARAKDERVAAVSAEATEHHHLGPKDRVDIDTGAITRAPAEPGPGPVAPE